MSVSNQLKKLVPLRRTWRLALYLCCVSCVLSLASARLLHAHAREALLDFGHRLSGLELLTNDAEILLVNGHRFHHAIVTLDEPLDRVLDRVEQRCADNPGLLDQALTLGAPQSERPSWARRGTVLREGANDRGMVVCFVSNELHSNDSLALALEKLNTESDATGFGAVIYTFAERAENHTRISTIWTDSGLNFFQLFSGSGDVGGTDSTALPRPPGARRTLVVSAEGAPFAVRVYDSPVSIEALRAFYSKRMLENGSHAVAENRDYETTAFLNQDGRLAFVSMSRFDERTYVTLTEAGSTDANVTAVTR